MRCYFKGGDNRSDPVQPRLIRLAIMFHVNPDCSAHSVIDLVIPSMVTRWLPRLTCVLGRLFRCCSILVAQRQFWGEYGPLTSILSKECSAVGRHPISLKNVEKEACHCGHIWIPRPPYLGKSLAPGFAHRFFAPFQEAYSGLLYIPCFRVGFRIAANSLLRQPQLFVNAILRLLARTLVTFPQSHLQNHHTGAKGSARCVTSNLPKRCPTRSMNLAMADSLLHVRS